MSISSRLAALGGAKGVFRQLVRMKDMRSGQCVGEDENGNKYYEDFSYVFGRSRYVWYNESQRIPDPTTITPEWHRWLHCMCEEPPTRRPVWTPEWTAPPAPSATGTDNEYVPYSTVKPKIEAWKPE